MTEQNPADDEPDWNALPHDPASFFQLPDSYDARDLKRAYNRLIRKYKPEKFPERFQQIRAAYEQLHRDLRYGTERLDLGADFRFDWVPRDSADTPPFSTPHSDQGSGGPNDASSSTPEPRQDETTSNSAERRKAKSSLVTRLENEPLEEIVSDLASKPEKSPRVYFQLAMIADMASNDGPPHTKELERWLLEGLREFPNDTGLLALFGEYLAGFATVARLPELLTATAPLLDASKFLHLTEKAWERLIRESSFDRFQQTLTRCETLLDTSGSFAILVFYLRILKPAIWKADEVWTQEKIASIEDHYFDLDTWAQEEFELIVDLRNYLECRESFVLTGALASRIDQTIQAWCLQSEVQADQAVLDCLVHIASESSRLLEEFEKSSPAVTTFLSLWTRIIEDVRGRLGEPPNPSSDVVDKHILNFTTRASRRYQRGTAAIVSGLLAGAGFAFGIWFLFLAAFWFVRSASQLLQGDWWGLMGLAGSLLLPLAAIAGFYFIYDVASKLRASNYPRIRPELIKLLRVVPLPIHKLAPLILAVEDLDVSADIEVFEADLIAASLEDDVAMEIYSLAEQCLNAQLV